VSPDKKSKNRIKVGDKAPNFVLPSHSGDVVSLRDFLGSKHAEEALQALKSISDKEG
jgi:hypothetical protein